MPKILITPEYVRKIGGDFKTAANENLARINSLNRQIEDLRAQWEGASREKFYADFETAKASMNAYSPMLDEIGNELAQIGQRFAEADQQAPGQATSPTQPSTPAGRTIAGKTPDGVIVYRGPQGNLFTDGPYTYELRRSGVLGIFGATETRTGYGVHPYEGPLV
jgi:WXG100 family type VII secretion target